MVVREACRPVGGSDRARWDPDGTGGTWRTTGTRWDCPPRPSPEIEAAGIVLPDPDVVRRYRLQRVRDRLRDLDYAGIILYDPVHIRYACDATNMTLWSAHNPCRYLWVGAEGPMILFDFSETAFLAGHNPLLDEVRPATQWMYELSGIEMERFLRQMVLGVGRRGGGARVGQPAGGDRPGQP